MAKQFSDEYYQDVDGEIDDSEEVGLKTQINAVEPFEV